MKEANFYTIEPFLASKVLSGSDSHNRRAIGPHLVIGSLESSCKSHAIPYHGWWSWQSSRGQPKCLGKHLHVTF